MAVQEEDALPEQAAVLDAIQVLDTAETALAPLDLSDEIKEASIYVLVRALLDAASMLGSVNVVELAMWARWKMKYDTPTLAYQGDWMCQLVVLVCAKSVFCRTSAAGVAKGSL